MRKKAFCGLELEALRIDKQGNLSTKPHPEKLGSPLFNPYFTLDYAEAQLEYTTPKFRSHSKALAFLQNCIAYAHRHHAHFWPLAMPPTLTQSPTIANFGRTLEAAEKELYRKGLKHRYGEKTQLICGLHYNFSFEEKISSESYLNVIRHFIENTWLFVYLFGASPQCDPTYHDQPYPHATSLRMSKLGYHSPSQCSPGLDYTTYSHYLASFEQELTTHSACYENIKEQLNSNILQSESELYTPIRAKGNVYCQNTTLEALKKCGIHYLEVRTLDLNPLCDQLIHPLDLDFLEQVLIHFESLPPHTLSKNARNNQHLIALYGRQPDVKLVDGRSFKEAALNLLNGMPQTKAVKFQKAKVNDVTLTYSHQIAQHDHMAYGLQRAQELSSHYQNFPYDEKLETIAHQSLQEEAKATFTLPGYATLEISTQCLIREALKRKIDVKVLDEEENFIQLNGEIVKEATKTGRDNYITPLIMENKHVSKILLTEKGVEVPIGGAFSSLTTALNAYPQFAAKKMVVKPNTTNFGIGVRFIEPNDPTRYEVAVKEGLTHSKSVIVEEFITGKEYRFIVIGNKVEGIIERIPANVTGNGVDPISTLVRQKNRDPLNYKDKKIAIRLGKVEKAFLAEQGLTFDSIPKLNETIYLRENTNVSTGGDCIDRTDEIDQKFHQIAVNAAHAVDAKLCGVDMVINGDTYSIIEINFNPMLMSHEFPTYGTSRPVAAKLLDFLGL